MMKNKFRKILLAGMMAAVIAGTVFTLPATQVFAAEKTVDQQQSAPPSAENPKEDAGNHSGHH